MVEIRKLAKTIYANFVVLIFRPYFFCEFPGWGLLYRLLRLTREWDPIWKSLGTRVVRGKLHGLLMELDLSFWRDRETFLLGRFWEFETQIILQQVLRRGGRFIDIGANSGMITLLGASAVGSSGIVEAVEPNPVPFKKLRKNMEINHLKNVRLHNFALSDANGAATLRVMSAHDASGSIRKLEDVERAAVTSEIMVQVRKGDDFFCDSNRPDQAIKIDVEGLKASVIRGLSKVIGRWRPIILAEYSDFMMGKSERERLVELMNDLNYTGYRSRMVGRAVFSWKLEVEKVSNLSGIKFTNICWVPRESTSTFLQRIASYRFGQKVSV